MTVEYSPCKNCVKTKITQRFLSPRQGEKIAENSIFFSVVPSCNAFIV
jgi:hypothetical protein